MTRRKWTTRAMLPALMALAACLTGAAQAIAADYVESGYMESGDRLPQSVRDLFPDCPDLPATGGSQNRPVTPIYCINIRAYNGDLKLGGKTADVGEIKIPIALGLTTDLEPVIVQGGGNGGGGDAAVKIPGGVLGVPELDPILDPIGLLSLTATPELGSPEVGGNQLSFAGEYIVGFYTDEFRELFFGDTSGEAMQNFIDSGGAVLTIPVAIKLNNALFGDNCRIGSAANPIRIALTNATTTPPAGIEPISGDGGEPFVNFYNAPAFTPDEYYGGIRGATFVDNAFEVPEAKKCDFLGQETHDGIEGLNDQLEGLLGGTDLPVDDLLGSEAGLFDQVVSPVAGLPSPAGNNRAEFKFDFDTAVYKAIKNPAP